MKKAFHRNRVIESIIGRAVSVSIGSIAERHLKLKLLDHGIEVERQIKFLIINQLSREV